MARINIEECWWADLRRSKLSKLLNSEDLADAAAIRMWRLAQDYWKNGKRLVPVEIWAHFEFGPKCVEAGLAVVQDSFVYVRGSSEHLSWAAEQRENAKKAGEESAKKRKEKYGTSQPPGGKGQKSAELPERQPNDIRTDSNGTEPSGSGSVSVSGSNLNIYAQDGASAPNVFPLIKEKKPDPYKQALFNKFYEQYPVSTKGTGAEKRFHDQIKTVEDEESLQRALDHYKKHLIENTWRTPKTSFASFLGTKRSEFYWRQWIDPDAGKLKIKKPEPRFHL